MHQAITKYIERALGAGLLTEAQLDRCNRRISRAARDIPPSDSAWVSALQAEGVVDHFQAECLLDRSGPGLVVGDYLIERRLAGSPGSFMGLDVQEHHPVVLRRLSKNLAETWIPTKHPCLARTLGFASESNVHFMVSEFVDGANLEEVLATAGPLSPRLVIEIARQLSAALAHAHKRGVVHGHLHARQVRIRPDGIVKLTDVGLGPRGALAPRSAGSAAGARADLADLGAILQRALDTVPPRAPSRAPAMGQTDQADEPPSSAPRLRRFIEQLRNTSSRLSAKAVVRAAGESDPAARAELGRLADGTMRSRAALRQPQRRSRRGLLVLVVAIAMAAAAGALAALVL